MEASRLIGVFIIVVVLGLLFLCVRLSRTTTESRVLRSSLSSSPRVALKTEFRLQGGARDGSGWGPGFDSRRAPAIQRTSSASKYPRGRVTLSATQVLFGGGEALRLPTSKVLEVATEAIATLHDMCTTSELHLITQTDDDEACPAAFLHIGRWCPGLSCWHARVLGAGRNGCHGRARASVGVRAWNAQAGTPF